MQKKTTKSAETSVEHDSGRETRVLLEEMNQGIKTISEQYGSIAKKLEEHDKRFDRVEMAVMEVDAKVNKLEKRTERIEQKLDTTISQNEERFKRVEDKIEIA